ncbi:MAG: RNA polymerase sigma factor [Acidimicrobiales bacterium]|nr:RNA polymerase sigma factor [Acidimicrobiales bacterium]
MSSTNGLETAARRGDEHSFTALLELHDETMRRLAFRLLGSAASMDDALQDAYLKAFRNIGRFEGRSAFGTWLYRIVYRTCVDHLRARQRHTHLALGEAPVLSSPDPTDAALDVHHAIHLLAQLPIDLRAVVVLVDGEGMSYADASAVLDVPEGTVASRLHRAHRDLRRIADTEGGLR